MKCGRLFHALAPAITAKARDLVLPVPPEQMRMLTAEPTSAIGSMASRSGAVPSIYTCIM